MANKAVLYQREAFVRIDESQPDPGLPYNDNTPTPHASWAKRAKSAAFIACIPALFFTNTTGQADFPEQNIAEKVSIQVPAKNFDKARQQYTYPAMMPIDPEHLLDAMFVSDGEKALAKSHHPDFIFDKRRIQYTYPAMQIIDPQQMTQTERVAGKVSVQYPDKIFDKKRLQYLYPAQECIVKHVSSTTTNQCTTYRKPTGTSTSVDVGAASNFDNVWLDDGVYASFNAVNDQALYVNFGDFGIPANATIKGVQVRVEGLLVGAGVNHNVSFAVRLSNILFSGSNSDFSPTTGSDEVHDLGGATNLWGASAAQATVASFNDGTFRIRLTMDSLSATSVDIDYFEASACYDLTTNSWAEIPPNIDKYDSPTMRLPNPNWGKKVNAPQLYSNIVFYPEPQPNPPEDVNMDKWNRLTPDIVFDKERNQYLYPYLFIDAFHLLDAETINDVSKWAPQKPDIIFDKARAQYTYPNYWHGTLTDFAEDITGKWGEAMPDVLFDKKRQQYTYPYLFIDAQAITQAETVSPDRFVSHQPSIVFDKERNQYLYPTWFYGTFEPIPVTVPEFVGATYQTNIPLFDKARNQHLYPNFFIDAAHLGDAETVNMDKWLRLAPDLVFDKKRQQVTYPHFFYWTEPIAYDATQLIDRYAPQIPAKIFDKKRQQYTYPYFFTDARRMLDAEITTADKWIGQYPNIIFDRARNQHQYPVFWFDFQFVEVLQPNKPDKWMKITPDIVWGKERNQYLYPYLAFYDGIVIDFCPPLTDWSGAGIPPSSDWSASAPNTTQWGEAAPNNGAWSEVAVNSSDWSKSDPASTDWEPHC